MLLIATKMILDPSQNIGGQWKFQGHKDYDKRSRQNNVKAFPCVMLHS